MSKGLGKKYIILLITLVLLLIVSLVTIFIKIGLSSYDEYIKDGDVKLIEVKASTENNDELSINRDLDSEEFKSGLYTYSEGGLYGFKNAYGDIVIKPKYEIANSFSEGLAAVYIEGKYGYIDYKGNMVIEGEYSQLGSFKNGLAIAGLGDSTQAIIDKSGKELFITKEYVLFDIKGDYILASDRNSTDGGTVYLNKEGKKVGGLEYRNIEEFNDDYSKVELNGMYGLIDEKGQEVIPLKYINISGFSEGYAVLSDSSKSILIDKNLKEVKLDNISFDNSYYSFVNGIIIGEDLNSLELVALDKNFNELFRLPFDYYFSGYSKSNVLVFYDFYDNIILIDTNGNINFKAENSDISYNTSTVVGDYFIIEDLKSNKFTVIDLNGKEMIPNKYSDIEAMDNFFICYKDGFFGEKIDIYYGDTKITDKSIKSSYIKLEGNGLLSIEEGDDIYYLNKYGQKFLNYLGR
ncbi:MAG: WG repeat-containing protein [Clostridium sp.]|uniref:WG repeat-containing protein n=1 Tax=Clostridium sp. TaxID=1506 RepID=UPI00291355A0|nr:WG repeat-containing protein [Clostridium sp.]MDU5109061.1 WG repeat-containing protein [Clostridium sp.]